MSKPNTIGAGAVPEMRKQGQGECEIYIKKKKNLYFF